MSSLNKQPRASKSLEKKPSIEPDLEEEEENINKLHKSENDTDVSSAKKQKKLDTSSSSSLLSKTTSVVRKCLQSIPFVGRLFAPARSFKVDPLVPNSEKFEVYKDYSFYLNQSDIGKNANKWYKGQILFEKGASSDRCYFVFFAWGRQGDKNPQKKLSPTGTLFRIVRSEFEAKFFLKTGNWWKSFSAFQKKPGKYDLVDTRNDDDDDDDDQEVSDVNCNITANNTSSTTTTLSKTQILKGLKVLKSLEQIFTDNKQQPLPQFIINQLSSAFFTLIPTDVGRRKITPIRSKEEVEEKQATLLFWLKMGFDFDETDVDRQISKEIAALPISAEEKKHLAMKQNFIEDLDLYNSKELGKKDHALVGLIAKNNATNEKAEVPPTLSAALATKKFLGFLPSSLVYAGAISSAVSLGEKLEKKQAGNPNEHITAQLYAAICLYSGNAIYATLNSCLRSESLSSIKPYFPYLRMLGEACRRLKMREATLYRGIGADLEPTYQEGKVITWYSVTSCTSAESVARGFMGWCPDGTFCTIKAKRAVEISSLSHYPTEKESLLLPGTQLMVKKAERKGKTFHVLLEEVGHLVDYSSLA